MLIIYIDINFDPSSDNVEHYIYIEDDGSFHMATDQNDEPVNKKETVYVCSECKSEKWIKGVIEKNLIIHCYVCNESKTFYQKSY